MKDKIIYFFLIVILLSFSTILVGILIYRADRTDKYFEAVRRENSQIIFN